MSREIISGYLGRHDQFLDLQGHAIGTYQITGSWMALGYVRMYQVFVQVDGVWYTGRTQGKGAPVKVERVKGKFPLGA